MPLLQKTKTTKTDTKWVYSRRRYVIHLRAHVMLNHTTHHIGEKKIFTSQLNDANRLHKEKVTLV